MLRPLLAVPLVFFVASAAPADVVHVDLAPLEVHSTPNYPDASLDFDGDGAADVFFEVLGGPRDGNAFADTPSGSRILDTPFDGFSSRVLSLPPGTTLGPGSAVFQEGAAILVSSGLGGGPIGDWNNGQRQAMGVRFVGGDGHTHFAWVGLAAVNIFSNLSLMIYEYEYQTTPDAPLTVGGPDDPACPPEFRIQPVETYIPFGENLSMTAFAVGVGVSHQWYRDGVAIHDDGRIRGTASPTVVFSPVQSGDDGTYTVVAQSACGATTSEPAAIHVEVICPPLFDQPPSDFSLTPGESLTLTAHAFGVGVSYQWHRNGVPLADDSRISGSNTGTLTINPSVIGDVGLYSVVADSTCGSTTSSTVQVFIESCLPVFRSQPHPGTYLPGETLVLSAAVDGAVTYQWYRDDAPLADGLRITGSASAQLTINPLTVGDSGFYRLVAANACGSVLSIVVDITVDSTCVPLAGSALSVSNAPMGVAVVSGFGAAVPLSELTVEFWQFAVAPAWQTTFNLYPVDEQSRFLFHGPFADGRVYWDCGECNPDFGTCATPGLGRLDYQPPAPITGSWQHFALVASTSGNFMRIYRNGVLEASKTGVALRIPATSSLYIGGAPTYHGILNGRIDEFRVWNVARTAAEIAGHFRQTVDPSTPGLFAYYRFDEGSGAVAGDLTGHGYTANLTGSARFFAARPCCAADFSRDGVLGVQDIFDFLAAYFAADPRADFNLSGDISVQDIFDFLAAYFAGCP